MALEVNEHDAKAFGVNEREPHGGTIYNTVLYFAPGGELAGRHRKLMPTGSERPCGVIDTGSGRIGGLICWENYMPLARFYLYARGVSTADATARAALMEATATVADLMTRLSC